MITKSLDTRTIFTQSQRPAQTPLDISVIVPTRNEAGNIEMLLSGIQKAFQGSSLEVVFVDDSNDDTHQVINSAVDHFPGLNVRLIHRPPEQRSGGLGGAVTVGLHAVRSKYACIMDGDLQHPPEVIPSLLQTAINQNLDLVVATRRSAESQVTGLNTARNLISRGLDLLARIFFPRQLRGVSDPLTGFFLVRVESLNLGTLDPKGFKILMEILVRNPTLRKAEVPFHFGQRLTGQSKASTSEAIKYLNLLWTLRFGDGFFRFIGFALVGISGILVNSAAVYLATDKLHIYYLVSAGIATVVSTLWNFVLTEALVYHSIKNSQGLARRLGLFFVMNLIALALRSPIIYLMTTVLGIYYVVSNFVSLALLTVLRFALADNIIWGKTSQVSPAHPFVNQDQQ